LLRGKQKARIFVYPVGPALFGKRAGSFGARPRSCPVVNTKRSSTGVSAAAVAEFRALQSGTRRRY